jgi:Reverse transcriptase (RNA-dependent DNA polymerase)
VKVTGKIKSKLQLQGKEAMFVGYAVSSTRDTYQMYVLELNSIHESRDVQWRKWMFFDHKSEDSIHAVDSVELIVNKNIVPLRTNVPQITNQIPQHKENDGAVKGQVKFEGQVEYVSEFDEDEELRETPRVIEIEEMEDEWSAISGSAARGRGQRSMDQGRGKDVITEQPSRSTANYYDALQDDTESQSEESKEGSNEGEPTSGSSFNPTVSEVDSTKYEEEEEFLEDDEAFFERLEEMTARIDAESRTDDDIDDQDKSNDARDREAINDSAGLRRSSRVIRAPTRLIEEMGVSIDEKLPNWKDCLVKVYETALVGAGIGGGFNHSSELNVIKYNEAMWAKDLEELTKWIKGMDEEHARFLLNEVWVAVLKGNHKDIIPITMTWALKLKASGVVRARCNVRGFEQIPYVHYDPDSKSSPVTTQAAIFVSFVLMMMATNFVARIVDVKGAFLKGRFASNDEVLMLEVPQGFRWIYDKLGEIMADRKHQGQEMTAKETMKEAKVIFQEWLDKSIGEKH